MIEHHNRSLKEEAVTIRRNNPIRDHRVTFISRVLL